MAEIVWTRSALNDLKLIHQYIAKDSKFYADRFALLLYTRVNMLENFPLSCRIVPEKEDETIRELIEGNYRIFYKISSKTRINILRIHHAAKKIR